MKKRMFMALAVALTGVSMVVAAGNGELKIQSEASVQKVHAAEIHQIGVEPIPATGQITIEDLLAVQGGETEDPRALEGVSDPEDVPVDEASVEDTTADEYASLAIANVTNYVNVRTEPNTDSAVVGKIYDGAVAQILDVAGEDQDWFRIISGNVEGYIKAEFFIYGDAAAEVVDNYVTRYAVVIADRLNVRQDPATDAKRIGYIDNGEKVKILENDGDWLKVQYTDSKEGYVCGICYDLGRIYLCEDNRRGTGGNCRAEGIAGKRTDCRAGCPGGDHEHHTSHYNLYLKCGAQTGNHCLCHAVSGQPVCTRRFQSVRRYRLFRIHLLYLCGVRLFYQPYTGRTVFRCRTQYQF